MKRINILFVCKHNVFRSKVAEDFFNRLNKNKKYKAESAGIIKWDKKDLVGDDKAYQAEKKIVRKFGIKIRGSSRGLSSSLLKKINILVIVADDVSPSIFKDKSFNGKVILRKTPDVKPRDTNKEKIALDSIKYIEKKVKDLVEKLR